jgi:methionyl-tRNA formyltransferase
MITIVGFLSRPHGYNALCAIIGNPNYQLLKVFTHKLKPKSEDIDRSERDDYSLFEQICGKNNIPLETIDSNSQIINNVPKCDFIVEISWRYLISKEIVKQASTLAFGVHRGKLPDYAGSEPIKQALEKNESEIVLSAHHLAEEIDSGGTISTITHLVNYENSKSLTQNIQRLRNEITPLFSKIVEITITKYQSISKEEK